MITLTADNFESEVLNSEIPVLVDFWATWCGPCKMLSPIVDEVDEECDGSFKVAKLNVDDNGALARKYKVMSIPTLLVFKNGEVVNRNTGVIEKEQIVALVK